MQGTRVSASQTGKGSEPPVEELATDSRKLPLGTRVRQSHRPLLGWGPPRGVINILIVTLED